LLERAAFTTNLYCEGLRMEESKGRTVPGVHEAHADMRPRLPNPRILGKLRSGRDNNRPSEDDIAKQYLGPRGLPGEPAQPNALRESETQIPKGLDSGHTA
jgi:hypothetical protein